MGIGIGIAVLVSIAAYLVAAAASFFLSSFM
jgi:hypothetical protein